MVTVLEWPSQKTPSTITSDEPEIFTQAAPPCDCTSGKRTLPPRILQPCV